MAEFPCPRCGQTRAGLEAVCTRCDWKPSPQRELSKYKPPGNHVSRLVWIMLAASPIMLALSTLLILVAGTTGNNQTLGYCWVTADAAFRSINHCQTLLVATWVAVGTSPLGMRVAGLLAIFLYITIIEAIAITFISLLMGLGGYIYLGLMFDLIRRGIVAVLATVLMASARISRQRIQRIPDSDLGRESTNAQFSIRNLMGLTLAVGLLFVIGRLSDQIIQSLESRVSLHFVAWVANGITLSAMCLLLMWALLSPGDPFLRFVLAMLGGIAMGVFVAVPLPQVTGIERWPFLLPFFISTATLVFCFYWLRVGGYRFVQTDNPPTNVG